MSDDPFAVLGLTPAASLAEVRAARRALAFDAHPDRGGDPQRMTRINAAFDRAVRQLTGRASGSQPATAPEPGPAGPVAPDRSPRGQRRGQRRDLRSGVEYDVPSFVIDALPAEAFEALLVVTSWIGEVLVDDPPYLLEVHLHEPSPCWCRVELVPDAGASTVSLAVARAGDEPPPTAEEVRDTWVANLNRLGTTP